jgi:hypothetical protein
MACPERGADADDGAARVDERPTRVTQVDRRVGLDEERIDVLLVRFAQRRSIDGKLADGKLAGTYDSNGQKGTFAFTKKPK